MPQVQPGETLPIPNGTAKIKIHNDSTTKDGHCNVFTGSGSENVILEPNKSKDVQLDGGDESKLDNTGKTVLTVTYL